MSKESTRSIGGGDVLAFAVTIASGTIAYADIQFFDNSAGDFDWGLGPSRPFNDPYLDRQFLDITRGPLDQLGAVYPYDSPGWGYDQTYTTFRQEVYYDFPNNYATAVYTYGGLLVDGYFIQSVGAGTQIGGMGQQFYVGFIAQNYYGSFDSLIPEGVRTYLGAQIKMNYETHYGWIGVIRNGFELETFGWAFEDSPNTPIEAGAVPAPGTLAALVLGAGALAGRRRESA
jgi:hypothetical protein